MRATIGAALAGLALLSMATTAMAQSEAAQSDVAEFRRLRAEATAAAGADDLVIADDRLARADALIPNHPGMILMRARLAAQRGELEEGAGHLRRYADAGLVVDIPTGSALSLLAGTPGYAEAAARIAANREPVGADRLSGVGTLPAGFLIESVVRDEARGRWLASSIAGRTILALSDDGEVWPWMAETPHAGGLLGLTIDPARGWVWAASAPLPPAAHGAQGGSLPRTALLRIELATGRINAWFEAPNDGVEHSFGDVALGPDGIVYVADVSGAVFRVRPAPEATLETVVAAGSIASPQGMVVTPDGRGLIVADYSSGVHRVDLATGAVARLAAPADASLIGVDGLATDGTAVYAIQNGVNPQRVLKLTPDVGWTRIEAVEVLAANLPEIDEPTTGLVHNGGLVFVSRSQWSDFEDSGALKEGADAPAIIARLRMD